MPELEVRGLVNGDARALLDSSVRFDAGRAGARQDPRGDARQSAGAGRAAPGPDADATGRRVRDAGGARSLDADREQLRPATRDAPRGRATPVAGRRGRAGRRPAAPAARLRAAGDLAVRGRRDGRVAGGGGARDVPPSAGALGRLPVRRRAGAPSGPPGAGAGHGSRRRSGSSRMASGCRGRRARRGRRRASWSSRPAGRRRAAARPPPPHSCSVRSR